MALAAPCAGQGGSALELKKLSLEDLVQQEVISVSRRPEALHQVASGLEVLRAEDIRRYGAVSVPEALRMAYNLQVARINAREWAVSSRGANTTTANKLLVMIDGRSVYTPLYSGVFWDVQHVFMPDLERVEVVSGPGGSAWGANAVHGVINILTKDARDTQGLHTYAGGGNEKRWFGGVRYGGTASPSLHYRVYGLGFEQDDSVLPSGAEAADAWKAGQAGFRVDWRPADPTHVTVQGDLYEGDGRQRLNPDLTLSGGNLRGRVSRSLAQDSMLDVQVYLDHTQRDLPGTFSERLTTHDLDAQHRFIFKGRHHVVWGAGFRAMHDRVGNSAQLAFLPARLDTELYTAFVQDTYELTPDTLRVTVGSKFEHNAFSGFEYQPSARLAWLPAPRHTLWGAVSRAVRTPSRIDRDFFVPGTEPYFLRGGPGFSSEKLTAYELGYRGQPTAALTTTATVFYHVYDDVRSVEPTSPAVAFLIANGLEGDAWGAELKAEWQAADWWRWRVGITHLDRSIAPKPWSRDLNRGLAEGSDPDHQVFASWSFNLPHGLEVDLFFRHVAEIPTVSGAVASAVPAYAELDAHLGWQVSREFAVGVTGRNLLDRAHPEFGPPASRREIERSVFATVTWRH